MNVLEKKALAFEKLAALQDENLIDEIITHLDSLKNETKSHVYNLASHAEEISKQYDETLKKLAQ